MQLSRRTRLAIRAPRPAIERLLSELPGSRLSLAGEPLTIGQGRTRAFSRETTLLARYVVCDPEQDEQAFLGAVAEALAALDIRIRKALSGRTTSLSTTRGLVHSRSLLLAGLRPEESIRLHKKRVLAASDCSAVVCSFLTRASRRFAIERPDGPNERSALIGI